MKEEHVNCLKRMKEIAAKLKAENAEPSKRIYVPKYGINNSFGWAPFHSLAEEVSGKKIEADFNSGRASLTPFCVKREFFELNLVSGVDIFDDLCQNDYWLWSLVEAVAEAALRRETFPIDAECFVDAIEGLKTTVSKGKFGSIEFTLIYAISETTTTMDLVKRSAHLRRTAEAKPRKSLAEVFRDRISKVDFLEYLEFGLILVDDQYQSDPAEANIEFNNILFLDWQVCQRGPAYVHREGLKRK